MAFIFRGALCASVCADCTLPLSNVLVRLYRAKDAKLTAAAPKLTQRILSEAEVAAKADRLIGEAHTTADGGYEVIVDQSSDESNYDGGPVEIDVRFIASDLSQRDGVDGTLQVSLTVLQPNWRQREQGYISVWDHCLSQRFWCQLLEQLDLWIICGQITDCETQQPVTGVKVEAYDADWLQDDYLGVATTVGGGQFHIWYTRADFETTIFPAIDLELFGGPDLYFRVSTLGGIPLLEESQSDGRASGREDVGHCFCVNLCVEEPVAPFENPYFYQVGDFNIAADIDTTSGLTLHSKGSHAGPNYGFFSAVKLKGYCPKTLPLDPSQVMHYRFLYIDPTAPTVEVPITGDLIGTATQEVVVGARVVPWDQFNTGLTDTYQDIVIRGSGTASTPDVPPPFPGPAPHGPIPPHILIPDADGWVRVDQLAVDNGFQGSLMRFVTNKAFPDGSPVDAGDTAGDPPTAPRNGRLVTIIFETATDPTDPLTYDRQLLEGKIYVNNWREMRLVDLQQFVVGVLGSCTPISNDVNINYTVDHELLHSWGLSIISAASPTVPPLPSGTGPRGANSGIPGFHIDVSDTTNWPSCSYSVILTARRSLTTGETDDDADNTRVTFCK